MSLPIPPYGFEFRGTVSNKLMTVSHDSRYCFSHTRFSFRNTRESEYMNHKSIKCNVCFFIRAAYKFMMNNDAIPTKISEKAWNLRNISVYKCFQNVHITLSLKYYLFLLLFLCLKCALYFFYLSKLIKHFSNVMCIPIYFFSSSSWQVIIRFIRFQYLFIFLFIRFIAK